MPCQELQGGLLPSGPSGEDDRDLSGAWALLDWATTSEASQSTLWGTDFARNLLWTMGDRSRRKASWVGKSGKCGKTCAFIVRTSPRLMTQLLHEMLEAFQGEKFQADYQALRQGAQHNNTNHARMVLLTFEVQKKTLPRFGFEASPKGVTEMRWETGLHADCGGENMSCEGDKVVAKLRQDIHLCLDMDVQKEDRVPIFHTVGDSHSCFGWPKFVLQHWQGPLLGFNVHRVDLRKLTPPLREGRRGRGVVRSLLVHFVFAGLPQTDLFQGRVAVLLVSYVW